MNENQKKALIGVGAVVLAMLIYPPYRVYGFGSNSSRVMESGYTWLNVLPTGATMDVATLIVQWIGVLIAGSIGYVVLRDKSLPH